MKKTYASQKKLSDGNSEMSNFNPKNRLYVKKNDVLNALKVGLLRWINLD
jgi:hypothetical protein